MLQGVAGPSSSSLGTFSLAICRNLNPFSSSGLHCSSPSAICWHTNDGRHVVRQHIVVVVFGGGGGGGDGWLNYCNYDVENPYILIL